MKLIKPVVLVLGFGFVVSSLAAPQLEQPKGPNQKVGVAASPSPHYQSHPSTYGDGGVGAYVAGGVGYGAGAGSNSDGGLGFQLAGGYNFSPSLGVEAGLIRLPAEADVGSKKDGSSFLWNVVGVMYRPLQPRLEMFGKAGLANVYSNVDVNGAGSSGSHLAAYLGAGVMYQITPPLNATMQGLVTVGSSETANTYGILFGVSYQLNPS